MDIKERASALKELTVGQRRNGENKELSYYMVCTMIKAKPDIGGLLERKVIESWWEVISH